MKIIFNRLMVVTLVITFLSACGGGNKTSEEAGELRREIDKTGETSKNIGGECGEHLEIYIRNVDKLLVLSKRRVKEGNTPEMKKEEEAISAEMENLSKEMKENIHVYMTNRKCIDAWTEAQQKYGQYIAENVKDFMPEK